MAVPDLLKLYMQPAVVAIAERIESDILTLYSQFTANTPIGTGGLPLTEAAIDSAETALFQAKVPASAGKYLVVDPAAYSVLRQIPRFSEYYSAGDAGLRAFIDGAVGKMKDFFIFRSLVSATYRKRACEHPQPRVRARRSRVSHPAVASAAARNRRHRRIRGDG